MCVPDSALDESGSGLHTQLDHPGTGTPATRSTVKAARRGWPDNPSGVGISDRRRIVYRVEFISKCGFSWNSSVTFNVKFMLYIYSVPYLLLKVSSWSIGTARCLFSSAPRGGPLDSCHSLYILIVSMLITNHIPLAQQLP